MGERVRKKYAYKQKQIENKIVNRENVFRTVSIFFNNE